MPPRLEGIVIHVNLPLTRVYLVYLPPELSQSQSLRKDLFGVAQFATSKKVAGWIEDAESNLPHLEGKNVPQEEILDVWGRKRGMVTDSEKTGGVLMTSEGWKKLGEWGGREGCVDSVLL